MIPPARTTLPSYSFTPSRLDLLSRPLRELPTPFLCAILRSSLSCLRSGDLDGLDLEPRQRLTMAGLAPVALLGLHLEDYELRPAKVLGDRRSHFGSFDQWRADGDALLA